MSLDSSLPCHHVNSPDVGVVVENEGLFLSSLLTLFDKLGCLQKHDEQYILADRPTQAAWESCMNFASSVTILELSSQGSEEDLKISSATYIRLLQQLRGKPLFPQLKRLCIKDYHGLANYLPLFLSSNLQTVQLLSANLPVISETTAEAALKNFICDLLEWSQEIQHLHITQGIIMPISLLDSISLLGNLRTLELSPIQVGSFQEFRPLAHLALESLTLELSCSSYVCLPYPITSLPDFLALLEKLHISGPSTMIADFVQSLGTRHLTSLTVKGEVQDSEVQVSTGGLAPRYSQSKGKKKPFVSMQTENVDHQITDFGSMLHTITSRWGDSLREMSITSYNTRIDFSQLSNAPLLEKIHVSDFTIDGLERVLKPTGVWCHLDTLCLTMTITFPLLSLIALSAPHLKELDLSIDASKAPPTENQQVLVHPLNLLKIHGPDPPNSGSALWWSTDNFSDLPSCILIARYLNALFPAMKELTSTSQIRTWKIVWQLMVLCQTTRADDNCRRPVYAQD